MIPQTTINKVDGQLGVPPITNPTGIVALIAPRIQGPASGTPALATKPSLIRSTYGDGLISEIPSIIIPQTRKPMLLLPMTATVAGTGISFTLVTAKTTVTGDYFQVNVTGPRLNDSDVSTALTALGNAKLPWEGVLVAGIDATATTIANLDTFLAGQEALGKYRMFVAASRLRTQATETEAQ